MKTRKLKKSDIAFMLLGKVVFWTSLWAERREESIPRQLCKGRWFPNAFSFIFIAESL